MRKAMCLAGSFVLVLLAVGGAGCPNLMPMPGRDPLPAKFMVGPASMDATAPRGNVLRMAKTNLTYFIANTSAKNNEATQIQLIADAFNRWSAVTPLSFTRTMVRTGADFVVGFGNGAHCELYVNSNLTCPEGSAFETTTLGHAYFPQGPNQGQCHMNEMQDWSDGRLLFSTLVHEIGHNLGLEHLPDMTAVMFASDNGQAGDLTPADITAIQRLYGSRDGSVRPVQSVEPPASDDNLARTAPKATGLDRDGDGLDDSLEIYVYGTNPLVRDSDGDGVDDGVEAMLGLQPTDRDTDNDGVPDGEELDGGTNAFIPDAGMTGDTSALAGEYVGQDSLGAPLRLVVGADGRVTGAVSIVEYTFEEDDELIGRAGADGRIEVVSYDYFFNYRGTITGNTAGGVFETEGGQSGTWTATRGTVKAIVPDRRPDRAAYVVSGK